MTLTGENELRIEKEISIAPLPAKNPTPDGASVESGPDYIKIFVCPKDVTFRRV
jgi:hypothetical protein